MISRYLAIFIVLYAMLGLPFHAAGQYERKSLEAVRVSQVPKMDGLLDDACWQTAPVAGDFIMDTPNPGTPLTQKTEVRVLYHDDAIYIGFMCFDESPDSILYELCGRDKSCNTDFAGVTFSCYADGINGFKFLSSPNGEQYDARVDTEGEDETWNAVWYSKAKRTQDGWSLELKIPFAAIRFPKQDIQVWNINFERDIRRHRHHGNWNGVDPMVAGKLTQMGTLTGIRNIDPPRRIFLFPYASSYYNTEGKPEGGRTNSLSYNYGLDLKLGLNDAFTLDATLIPDFGQTISDQKVLNLSAFELQFSDNRQFFTEGTELFSRANLFYSRRIGFELPLRYFQAENELTGNEIIESNPAKDQIINAMKISGRNKNKLGVGFFNAVTAPSEAIALDTLTGLRRGINTSSLTNYNVTVFDQILPNNSFVSLIHTSVLRSGGDYDVNVLGTAFDIRDKNNAFSVSGSGAVNRKWGPEYAAGNASRNGFRQDVGINKISGNWNASIGQWVETDTYDPNDLGFLQANNSIGAWLFNSYSIYKPFGRFNRMWSDLNVMLDYLYFPRHFSSLTFEGSGGITTKKFNTWGFNVDGNPIRGYDFFEPRVWGRYFRTYSNVMTYGWYSSDYRKKLAIDIGSGYGFYADRNRYRYNFRLAPRIRFNNHLFLTYVYSFQSHYKDIGFAYAFEDEGRTRPLFGTRDVISHTNVLTLKYAFNAFAVLNTRVRHYWGYTRFSKFHGLTEEGELAQTDVTAANQNFNTFTIDCMFTWIFTPGSELSLVWKNDITDSNELVPSNLADDLSYTFALPQNNSYSIKLIWFVDYHAVHDLLAREQRIRN
ncbi:MAG: DUF5916 domain-containing protein [Flavobacteriales bacterium]|jgi:hypothetical protein